MSSLLQIPTFINHENVIKFDKRPFTCVEQMNEQMRELWNNTVGPRDRIWILGDFLWLDPRKQEEEYIKFTKSLKGKKVLIAGNHDDIKNFSPAISECFENIFEKKELKMNKKVIVMDHYPLMSYHHDIRPNTFHLHGHVHNTIEQDWVEKWTRELVVNHKMGTPTGQIINVGCMMPYMNYIPRTMEEIIEAGKEKFEWKV